MSETKNLWISFSVVGALTLIAGAYLFWSDHQNQKLLAESRVAREEWTRGVKSLIPVSLCPTYGYFMNCFDLNLSECRKRAIDVSHRCVDTAALEMPEHIQLPADGRRHGLRIAQCVDRSLEFQLRDRKKSEGSCSDPMTFGRAHPPPTVTKAEFMISMEAEIPASVCDAQSFFRLCYLVTDEDCMKETTGAVDQCLMHLDQFIPGAMQDQTDTAFFGARVGGCVGQKLDQVFAAQKMGRCQEPSAPSGN